MIRQLCIVLIILSACSLAAVAQNAAPATTRPATRPALVIPQKPGAHRITTIVTANGKNIAPQLIESRIGQDYYVEQLVVFGDKQKYLTALIVPAFAALEEYAHDNGIAYQGINDLLKKPEILKLYADRIEGQSKDLAHHEKIVRFTLLERPFTIEKNEMTPSNKLKRKVIGLNYDDVIRKMYKD